MCLIQDELIYNIIIMTQMLYENGDIKIVLILEYWENIEWKLKKMVAIYIKNVQKVHENRDIKFAQIILKYRENIEW